jgi:hypothetical protein
MYRYFRNFLGAALAALVLFAIIRTGRVYSFYLTLGWYTSNIRGTIDAPELVTSFLALCFALPCAWGIGEVYAVPWKFWNPRSRTDAIERKRRGKIAILSTGVAYMLFMNIVSLDWNFDSQGKPLRYVRVFPDGRHTLTYQKYDHDLGRPNEPVTTAAMLDLKAETTPFNRINPETDRFFDRHGHAIVFYERSPEGDYWLYSGPGYSPTFGVPLRPVTREIVAEIRNRLSAGKRIYHLGDGLGELEKTLKPYAR